MNDFLHNLLDSDSIKIIQSKHNMQKNHYGVYEPPTLRQLVSLKYLLVSIGYCNDIEPEELLIGLSRIECQEVLKKLNKIYKTRHAFHSQCELPV